MSRLRLIYFIYFSIIILNIIAVNKASLIPSSIQPDVNIAIYCDEQIATVHELVGINDYGPDASELYNDNVAYELFKDLGLHRLRIWCAFGWQLGQDLGWNYNHTIFNGTTLKDAQNPYFYNWSYLDMLFNVTYALNAKPIFTFVQCPPTLARDNYSLNPPNNFTIYAEVCAHIIMHYTQGWASGHKYDLDYIEIGNEPNFGNVYWNGTKEEFYNLYGNVSFRLRQIDNMFKIGGPGLAGIDLKWLNGFFDKIKNDNLPFDFFSWHGYSDSSKNISDIIVLGKNILDNNFTNVEYVLDEWGQSLLCDDHWNTIKAALHASHVLTKAAEQNIQLACFAFSKDALIAPKTNASKRWGTEFNFGCLTRNETTIKTTYSAMQPYSFIKNFPIVIKSIVQNSSGDIVNETSLNCLTTRDGYKTYYNIILTNHENHSAYCSINLLNSLPGSYKISLCVFNNESFSIYHNWSPITTSTTILSEYVPLFVDLPSLSILWIRLNYIEDSDNDDDNKEKRRAIPGYNFFMIFIILVATLKEKKALKKRLRQGARIFLKFMY